MLVIRKFQSYNVHFPAPYNPRFMRVDALATLNQLSASNDRVNIALGDFNITSLEDAEANLYGKLNKNWYISHLDQCAECKGTNYYFQDDRWSFLDAVMLKKNRNSKFTKELGFKLGIKDIHVINPGCNYPIVVSETAREFSKNIYGNASPKLITISRLDGRKSHHNVMMTVKNLLPKYPSLKYVSIGDGEEGNNLLRLRKTLGLEKSVEFIFKSTEQEKLALLEQSNIFVMPSVNL